MDLNTEAMKSFIKYITSEEETFCRLCFTSTNFAKHKMFIDDCIKIEKPYLEGEISYNDMFQDLGVNEEPSMPKQLCNDCATTVVNAYLFKRLNEYYNKQWMKLLKTVVTTIDLTRTVSESVKTVYLMIDDKQSKILTSRSTTKNIKKSFSKMKEILKYKQNYSNLKKMPFDIICEECGKKFKSSIHLSKHHDKEHKHTKYPCPNCPKVVHSQMQLEKHIIRVHLPKKFPCTLCNKTFSTATLLDYHNKSNHMSVICKLCFVQFPSKRELRSHMDKHDILNCSKCGKSYYNRQTYKIHIKTCGNSEQRQVKYFCDICNKGYVHKAGLRSHLKIDHGFGINMHCCKWCDKKYDAASKLKIHMVVHTRERNFQCEQCNNKFVTQAALVNHIRLHTGEKPFPCDLCDQSFISASRRMEHKHRKHFGPTKECPLCQVKFALSSQLKKHIQRHYNPQSKLYVADLNLNEG